MKTTLWALVLVAFTQTTHAGPMARVQQSIPEGKWTGHSTMAGRKQPCALHVRHDGPEVITITMEHRNYRGQVLLDPHTFDARSRDTHLDLEQSDSIDLTRSFVLKEEYPEDGGEPNIITGTYQLTVFLTPTVSAATLQFTAHDGVSDPARMGSHLR